MKQFILISIVLYCFIPSHAQSKVIQELKDSNSVQLGLHFVPSTLRMLNIQKDTAFDEMIKGVEKLNFLIMKKDKFSEDTFFNTVDRLQAKEDYEEYIIWDGNGDELQVFGKPNTKQMIGLAQYDDKMYIFELKGTIDLMKIPEIYEKVSTQDDNSMNGFNIIYDMINDNERSATKREKRNKERAERDRIRDSTNATVKVDSSALIKK